MHCTSGFSGGSLDPLWRDAAGAWTPIMLIVDGALRIQAQTMEGSPTDVAAECPLTVEKVRFVMTTRQIDGEIEGDTHAYVAGPTGRFPEI